LNSLNSSARLFAIHHTGNASEFIAAGKAGITPPCRPAANFSTPRLRM
jgi:hypothetical protein